MSYVERGAIEEIEVGGIESMASGRAASPLMPEGRIGDAITCISPIGSIGRIKPPPICRNESLVKESVSSDQLSKMCWSTSPSVSASNKRPVGSASISKHSFSTENIGSPNQNNNFQSASPIPFETAKPQGPSDQPPQIARPYLFKRMVSRTGRENQRWVTDAVSNQLFRLVTGTVPIMNDGRILVCSSSRKQEWILPKGGWEADETMEESALRETFEEAGVLGTLGPRLGAVEYETRKAKKRRLEREEMLKKFKQENDYNNTEVVGSSFEQQVTMPPPQPLLSAAVSVQSYSSCGASSEDEHVICPSVGTTAEVAGTDAISGLSPVAGLTMRDQEKGAMKIMNGNISPECNGATLASLQALKTRETYSSHLDPTYLDDTASVASVASGTSDASVSYAYVRMSLFPLYVSEVRDEWPESGRARKVLDIDSAIEIMESRPEFRAVLVEVKERGLHLAPTTLDIDKSETESHLEREVSLIKNEI